MSRGFLTLQLCFVRLIHLRASFKCYTYREPFTQITKFAILHSRDVRELINNSEEVSLAAPHNSIYCLTKYIKYQDYGQSQLNTFSRQGCHTLYVSIYTFNLLSQREEY